MTSVTKFWPLLCGTHRYEKTLSTRGQGAGVIIEAPILAYLIETRNGRILYDVGCDYQKIHNPLLRKQYYEHPGFAFGPPEVTEEQRLPSRLAVLGLDVLDIDCVFCGHLHFDHAGGLQDFSHADVHVHTNELMAALEPASAQGFVDGAYFSSDYAHNVHWCLQCKEYSVASGVQAIETPGHTAGHMSLWIELPKGKPILLCGDAADLSENLDAEIAPGLCWQDDEGAALASIRKLKQLAQQTGAELWPNHDMSFFSRHNSFPLGKE
jgi:N-acyl homoserine lactone hydrolase